MSATTLPTRDSLTKCSGNTSHDVPPLQSGTAILRHTGFAPPPILVDALRLGRPVVLCDDEDREDEGDLVFAAQFATPALVARFGLQQMVPYSTCPRGTAFTASVDAAEGIGTGISARNRARTIRMLGNPATLPNDLISPGHIFPLAARAHGVAERQGHTEGAVALVQAAELVPSAVICEILDADGEPMRRDELLGFARAHAIPIGTVAALIDWSGMMARPEGMPSN